MFADIGAICWKLMRTQLDAAIPGCQCTRIEVVKHGHICLCRFLIPELDGVWHAQPQCAELLAHCPGAIGSRISASQLCSTCFVGTVTLHVPDQTGLTTLQGLENWMTDKGMNARPLTEPYDDAGYFCAFANFNLDTVDLCSFPFLHCTPCNRDSNHMFPVWPYVKWEFPPEHGLAVVFANRLVLCIARWTLWTCT